MEDSRWRIAVPAVMADGRPRLSEKKPAREVPLASLPASSPGEPSGFPDRPAASPPNLLKSNGLSLK